MAFSLNGPAYTYRSDNQDSETAPVSADRVIYDRLWDRILHFPASRDDGFFYVDVGPITSQRESQLHQGSIQTERLN